VQPLHLLPKLADILVLLERVVPLSLGVVDDIQKLTRREPVAHETSFIGVLMLLIQHNLLSFPHQRLDLVEMTGDEEGTPARRSPQRSWLEKVVRNATE